jgi:hypothetical protein
MAGFMPGIHVFPPGRQKAQRGWLGESGTQKNDFLADGRLRA